MKIDERLNKAIFALDLKEVKRLINQEGLDPNKGDWENKRPLDHAIDVAETKISLFLLSKKVDFNYINEHGSPLINASSLNDIVLTRKLLKMGADTELQTKTLETALTETVIAGYASTIRELLKYGANINHQNKIGNTAIMKAAYLNRVDSIEELLKHKPDLTIKNNRGETFEDLVQRKPQLKQILADYNKIHSVGKFADLLR